MRIIVLLLLAALSLACVPLAQAAESAPAADLQVFVRPGCPYCETAKQYLAELQRSRPTVRIQIRDITADRQALVDLQNLADRFASIPSACRRFTCAASCWSALTALKLPDGSSYRYSISRQRKGLLTV